MKTSEEQFEEWASGQLNVCIPSAWQAWKASREMLEIELPERIPHSYKNDYWSGADNGFNQGVDSCRISIEQAGVKVKK